jgi:hypothetical protein
MHANSEIIVKSDVLTKVDKKIMINWESWKEKMLANRNFDICLDEFHNVMHSRRAMSNESVELSKWIAQIRKICGGSDNDLILVSQELERIDVTCRDLANQIILCRSIKLDQKTDTVVREGGRTKHKFLQKHLIMQYVFNGLGCVQQYKTFRLSGTRSYSYRKAFVANPYYRFYDTLLLVEFDDVL